MGKSPGSSRFGEEDFIERVKKHVNGKGSKREQPAARRFEAKDLRMLLRAVARHFNIDEAKLARRRTGYRNERAIAMELMYRYGAVSQRSGSAVLVHHDGLVSPLA